MSDQTLAVAESRYRADIDGLRGISILIVVFFHAKLPGAGGGFTGIDMFFVISGFVITRTIMSQQRSDKFELHTFYVRRVLRLVPATIPVIAVTTIFSTIMMSQKDFRIYLYSVFSNALFASNIFFYIKTDYFEPFAETQPLLHTWSLSVEEQFYLLWPIILVLGATWLKRPALLCLMALSLAVSLGSMFVLYPEHADAGYYLLHARFWEIMVGALVAFLGPLRLGLKFRSLAGAAGLVGLICSFILISAAGGYPNMWALVPTLSTAAIISAGDFPIDRKSEPPFANRIVGSRYLVLIGVISYSIYLWHWPILTIVRLAEVFPLNIGLSAALMLFAIPVAWASYVWVERPMRRLAQHRHAGRIATAVLFGSIALSVGSALAARELNKLWTTSPRVELAIAEQDRSATVAEGCHSWPTDRPAPDCRHAPTNPVKGEWLLIGDSHSEALAHGLAKALMPQNIALTHLSQSSCPAGKGFEVWIASTYTTTSQCASANRRIVDEVIGQRRVDTLVIASHWPLYGPSPLWDGVKGVLVDQGKPVRFEERLEEFIQDVKRRYGSAVRIVLISPIPLLGTDVPQCVLRRERLALSTELCLVQPLEKHKLNIALTNEMLYHVAAATGARIINGAAAFCNDVQCRFGTSESLWWRDDNHLSRQGALIAGRSVVAQIIGGLPESRSAHINRE